MLSERNIIRLRRVLANNLHEYHLDKENGNDYINLNMDHELFEKIIFLEEGTDGHKEIAIPMVELKKLDLTGVSWDNVLVSSLDFNGSKGVVINPTTVYNKSLKGTKLGNVEIEGNFDNVCIERADFTGCTGTVIDPQLVRDKSLAGAKLSGVCFTGDFDGVTIAAADFTGSKGAKIDPQKIAGHVFLGAKLCDAELINTFDDIDTSQVNLDGVKGVAYDPEYLKNLQLIKSAFPKAK